GTGDLDVVGVGDDATADILGGAGGLGESGGELAAGARLGDGDGVRPVQELGDLLVDGAAVEGVERVWVSILDDGEKGVIRGLGGGFIARDDLDLATFEAGGYLELLERNAVALGDAQGFGDLRLWDSEQA